MLKDWSSTPALLAGFAQRLRSATRCSFVVLYVLTIMAAPWSKLRAMSALQEGTTAADAPSDIVRDMPSSQISGPGATINVTWSTGCETPPAGAVAALDYAAGIWGGLISSTATIEVSACWTSTPICAGLACGDTTAYLRNFSRALFVDTYYPIALANALSGQDLDPMDPDMTMSFASGENWSFETTTPSPTGIDFVSVALHEMGHGLGFVGNMYESYSVGFCGNGLYGHLYPCPTVYDRFAVDSGGISLPDYLLPNPLVLGAKLESDANFGGANTVDMNGRAVAKLYTPATWQQGSSLSHLDPVIFGGGENRLMLPTYQNDVRHPGSVTMAILQDIGWLRADGAPNVIPSGPLVVGIGQDVAFGADFSWTGHTGQAITYTWTVKDWDVITHTARGITDSATLSWTVPGLKTVAATAIVSDVSASATRLVMAFDVAASGLPEGDTNRAYTFNAALEPTSAALPVTYTWQATDLNPITHLDMGTTDAITFTWATAGTKTVTVTAAIADATAQSVHTINIGGVVFDQFVFLPVIQRQQ